MFDAFHLPSTGAYDGWQENADEGWRVPILSATDVIRVCATLRENRTRLRRCSIRDIVHAIDAAAARLADPADPLRRSADALLPVVTGMAPAMCMLVLDRMTQDWRAPALQRLLALELRDPAVLDGFARIDGRLVHASADPLSTHVLAGNVPGVAVTSVVRSLLVKSAVFARTPEREPVLVPLFARALASVDADVAACVAATRWPRAAGLDAVAIGEADAVVVYGGEEAVAAVRQHARPGARIVEHGPRVSFGLVCREAISDAEALAGVAADAAGAAALFDQQGCVSPHVLWVEGDATTARRFAAALADAFARLGERLPRGRLEPAEAAAIHALRASTEFRAIAGQDTEVFAPTDTSATVLFEVDPAFAGSPLNRVIRVKPLASLDALPPLLLPVAPLLQTAGYAGPAARIAALAQRLVEAGVTRLAPFASMPFPPPFWHHDGRGPLSELVSWADLEEEGTP